MIRFVLALALLQAPALSAETLLTAQVPQRSTGTQAWALGVRITIAVPGRITAIRYHRQPDDPGPHVGRIWASSGEKLAEVFFLNESASGWQRQPLVQPLFISSGDVIITVDSPLGARYSLQPGGFPVTNDHLAGVTGLYGVPGQFPRDLTPTNYFRDCEFIPQSIVLVSDNNGGFVATLDGFQEGPYLLSVTLKDRLGVSITESLMIDMPPVKP